MQDFFSQVSLAGIFLGGIVTPPPAISNIWSVNFRAISKRFGMFQSGFAYVILCGFAVFVPPYAPLGTVVSLCSEEAPAGYPSKNV